MSLRATTLHRVVHHQGTVLTGVGIAADGLVREVVQAVLVPRLVVPVVVIHRRTQGIEYGAATGFDGLLSIVRKAVDGAPGIIEHHLPLRTLDGGQLVCRCHLEPERLLR